jgi:hypothetical protein
MKAIWSSDFIIYNYNASVVCKCLTLQKLEEDNLLLPCHDLLLCKVPIKATVARNERAIVCKKNWKQNKLCHSMTFLSSEWLCNFNLFKNYNFTSCFSRQNSVYNVSSYNKMNNVCTYIYDFQDLKYCKWQCCYIYLYR